jgi:hypothetical protein
MMASAATAQPTFQIAPPIVKGASSATARPDANRGRAMEEELRFSREVIFVEGFRDPDERRKPVTSVEQRVANVLNTGSPELITNQNYDGCLYTGLYFSCGNPLEAIVKNAKLWTR